MSSFFITLKIKVPCLLWILIQSHKHQEKLNSRCNVLLWTNRGWVSAAQERPTTTWAGRVQRTGRGWLGSPISFEQWITDLPISGRQTCMTDGGVGAEVEDSLKGSLGGGYGQKKEPTALKGMLRISVEGRWAGDRKDKPEGSN